MLSTLCFSVGPKAGTTGNENALVQAIRRGGSESFNQVGQRVVSRNLDIQPTLTIRPGFPGPRDRQSGPRIPLAEYEVICRAVDNAEFPVHLLPFPHISEEVSRHSSFKQKPAEVVFPMNGPVESDAPAWG